nr:arsenate reductase ArsC [Pseudonocardia sp. ICBG1034]
MDASSFDATPVVVAIARRRPAGDRTLEHFALTSPHPRLQQTVDELRRTFHGTFGPETIKAVVVDVFTKLALTARITTHLPVLAARHAHQRLAAAARSPGAPVTTTAAVPEVLFVCVHNAGRSQMAAALLAHHANGAVRVTSAGSAPAETINPAVREVMAEIGLSLDTEFPKRLTTEAVEAAAVVITMGCGDACPVFPGKRYLDWELTDPAGKTAEQIRPIRDDIDARVRRLLTEVTGAPTEATTP